MNHGRNVDVIHIHDGSTTLCGRQTTATYMQLATLPEEATCIECRQAWYGNTYEEDDYTPEDTNMRMVRILGWIALFAGAFVVTFIALIFLVLIGVVPL